ncbi:MAG: FdhF/YdeP family oxidoreductase [Corticimicrobacter sp.]|uniref:FdhF/YdeP family oxidoreductase n=1 Tax=Corticimicrobacter sp. TaxID=2678536 RepID=UPI0032DA34E1
MKPYIPYTHPAGGWDALKAMEALLLKQDIPVNGLSILSKMNQHGGFDCPGCGWADPLDTSRFEYCENGGKAIAWEATPKRCTPEFFAQHTVTELEKWDDYALEMVGRLTHPMRYDAASDKYLPVSWEDAYALVGQHLNALDDPNQVDFYTSGRASNEAAYLFQLFAREYGTNNFPDCSNMCHEPTSVGLPRSIGVGKGTVVLDDFDQSDCIFIFGQNPGTNSPRMMTYLRNAARRGAVIMSFNPFRERALERFQAPQDVAQMATFGSTEISSRIFQVRVGGDVAAIKGIMKLLVEADEQARANNDAEILDWEFIRAHTVGIEPLIADLKATEWADIERKSGLTREDLSVAAGAYAKAERAILAYGMGITQHRHGTHNVQQIANLALLRGNVGKAGAGICPVRGHSNVQGDRTVGITEIPSKVFLDRLQARYGFEPPRKPGRNVLTALEAMVGGASKVFIGLGGNFAVAVPDWARTQTAMRALNLTVQISTKLNRSHLIHGRDALILPCLGRTELDVQATGPQSMSVEDTMSMVHASTGSNPPASEHLRSEVAIIGGMARATLGAGSKVDWESLVGNYALIRDDIEAVFPDIFPGYNKRLEIPGGFHLTSLARERVWGTPSGKANFLVHAGLCEDEEADQDGVLWLSSMRSHDQYNTTLYSYSDRYRGIHNARDVLFINAAELRRLGLADGDRVDIISQANDGVERMLTGFQAIEYDFPDRSCAAYFPEANPLVPLYAYDPDCFTPASKGIPVRVVRAGQVEKSPEVAEVQAV